MATKAPKETPVDSPANYFQWGFILISLPNLLLILLMVVVFVIALLAPFPHGGSTDEVSEAHDEPRRPSA